jgi:hypothetical protein
MKRSSGTYLPKTTTADGQWRREHEADRAPDHRPERDGDQERGLRDAGTAGIEHRFEHHVREELEHDKEAGPEDRACPPLEDCQAQGKRQQSGDPRPNVWNEAEHGGDEPPEYCVGQADQQQPRTRFVPRQFAVRDVHDRLHQQITADSFASLIECQRRQRHPTAAHESDQPVGEAGALEDQEGARRAANPVAPSDGSHGRRRRGGPRDPNACRGSRPRGRGRSPPAFAPPAALPWLPARPSPGGVRSRRRDGDADVDDFLSDVGPVLRKRADEARTLDGDRP